MKRDMFEHTLKPSQGFYIMLIELETKGGTNEGDAATNEGYAATNEGYAAAKAQDSAASASQTTLNMGAHCLVDAMGGATASG